MAKLQDQILDRKQAAENFLRTKRAAWDVYEKLFHNWLEDVISLESKSRVFDPKLSTLLLERCYRVMAQLPVGKIKPISKNDMGAAHLMNLLLDKYVIPNANSQFDFLTKLRMVDMYSNIYGNFFAMIDWDLRKNGYVGPDIWLLNIRDIFPQVGAVSINDSDYIIVRTWKPLSFFENLKSQKGYKNVSEIVTKLKEKSGSKEVRDSESTSRREEDQYPDAVAAKKAGFFEVLTQYEKDRWVDFCVDADLDFRDIKNPHENDELPIACKYSIPLLDDFMGMGDMERGTSMQRTINSIWNLYLDAVKMSIFPPTLLNKDAIATMSSIKWGAAEKWLVRGNVDNAARTLQLTPQGIATFNNTYQVATASLLNMFGTTETATTAQTDVGYGKTPQALRMQAMRENARDSADRYYMEMFLKEVMRKMVNLLSKKQSSALTIRLFEDELKQMERSYPEIKESYDEKTGKLTVDKKKTGSVLYDYELVSGSTYAVDQQTQQQNLSGLLQLLLTNPQLIQQLGMEGYNVKLGEMLTRIIANSGIQDWDKIIEEKTEEEKDKGVLEQDAMQFVQAVQQTRGGGIGQVPPEQGGQPPMEQPGQLMGGMPGGQPTGP